VIAALAERGSLPTGVVLMNRRDRNAELARGVHEAMAPA
jgi:hypothetical protein